MRLIEELEGYVPYNEQEEHDKKIMIDLLRKEDDLYTRENPSYHLTASAWVVNHDRTRVLLAYHNIYDSWAWLGGHADGEHDLLKTALKEVREESGVTSAGPVIPDIYSVEILTVDGHVKRGEYISSHLHLNVTYLLEADENEALHDKPDENQAVGWFPLEEVYERSTEPWFVEHIYKKLNEKLKTI